jgi:hypothetical protein
MPRYQVITLVDITRTNPDRSEKDHLRVSQQANFNSLIQAIGLRSNVDWETDPQMHQGSIPTQLGKANHWIWEFNAERDEIFLKDKNPVGLLIEDLNGVPVITKLNDSADIYPAVFKTQGDDINTWFTIII